MVMKRPQNVRRFAKYYLESGSENPAELANNTEITFAVQSVVHPPIVLEMMRLAGPRANFPIPGKLQDMQVTLTLNGVFSSLMMGLGKKYIFDVTEELMNPPSDPSEDNLFVEYAGLLNSPDLGTTDVTSNETRTLTLTFEVLRIKMSKGTDQICDLDIENDLYLFGGQPLFPDIEGRQS